jgi:hypothetical protein
MPRQRKPRDAKASFFADIARSIRVWRSSPGLPLLTLVILGAWSLVPATGWFGLLGLFLTLLAAGWAGTQRIWYLRAFRGKRMTRSDVVDYTLIFTWRFLKLGVLTGLALLPAILAFSFAETTLRFLALVAVSLAIDALLTFVTPALSYSTRKVLQAIAIGVPMIVREWPTCRWYVLVPPLAMLVVARGSTVAVTGLTMTAVLLTLGAVLIGLVFKGATAAYYLRRVRVPDEGAIAPRPSQIRPTTQ